MAATVAGTESIVQSGSNPFPDISFFEDVCRRGLSLARPLRPEARSKDPYGWNYGSAQAPSYYAYGRLRFLVTLDIARSIKPERVLEIAAGDGALCACLEHSGAQVVANDLRREN